jgi:hypothetical protein
MVVPIRGIEAHVDAPQVVPFTEGAEEVEVAVRTGLTNTTENDLVLHAPDEDQEIFWHVLDENHREVQREKPEKTSKSDVEQFRTITIAAGLSDHETETLVLNAKKLKNGGTYTVRAEIFGQIAEAEFVAVETVPLTPLQPAKQATASKKAGGKKKAAPRKKAPAKKKPAAKKTSTAKKSTAKKKS